MYAFLNNIVVRAFFALIAAIVIAKYILPLFVIPDPFNWILNIVIVIALVCAVLYAPRFPA